MKKVLLFFVSFFCVSMSFAQQAQNVQQRIDSIRVAEVRSDSTKYEVYFTTLSGYDNYNIEYKENGATLQANILYSLTEKQQQTTIAIKNDTYNNAVVAIMNRFQTGGTTENPEFSEWNEVDAEEIDLRSEKENYSPLLSPSAQWNEFAENMSSGYVYKKNIHYKTR
ncbi:MAG: hypothetical protein LBU90_08865 [Bacteroidales bacterium]|jgi:biopolymer transport protein ExbD|nr:hypothetical protein [Bacteroidales bacterium]